MNEPESMSNVGACHSNCAPKPDAILAQKPLDWFIGKFVKLGFPVVEEIVAQGGPNKEHMWVAVERIATEDEGPNGEELVGKVNNDPVFATDWPCDSEVAFKRDECEMAILEDGSFFRPGLEMN